METITFMSSLLTFYIKGEIKVENNFLKLKIPNTLLALIPLGSRKNSIPINQISDASSSFKLRLKDFLVGIIEAFIGLCTMFGGSVSYFLIGLIILLVGVNTVIRAFQTLLVIRTTAGAYYVISFLIFESSKAEHAAESIVAMIASRMDDTNTRIHTEKQMEQNAQLNENLINAINNRKD